MKSTPEDAIRKEIAKEEKDEDIHVRQAIKDISLATKEQQKAHKAVRKADSTVAKLGKKESVATAAVQKATHEHDIAATNLRSAQRDAEIKRNEDMRLQRELDEKKARLDTALQEQKIHKKGRESRLLELESSRESNPAAIGGAAGVAGAAGAAGHHGTHLTGAKGEGNNAGTGPNAGTRSTDPGTTGNIPGQYGTGPQAPGTRTGGPGYAGHHTAEAMTAGAGLTGHGGDDRIRDDDGLGVGQIRTAGDQAIYGPSGASHRSDAGVGTGDYAGERPIGLNDGYPTSGSYRQTNLEPGPNAGQPAILGENGPSGARDTSHHPGVNTGREGDTGYPRQGPRDFGGPGNIPTAMGPNQSGGEQAISGQATDFPNANTGTGCSGAGGENLGLRGDPMVGGSGTGADPGIRSGGARDFGGGRGDHREFIGERNVGLGGVGDTTYAAEHIGDQQYIHRGTGISGRQGNGEDTEFSRDRMVMTGADRIGPGLKQTGDIDSRIRGPMSETQGLGVHNMPGGYT